MRNHFLLKTLVAGAAALSLAACDRAETQNADAKIDRAVDRTQQRLADAGEKTQQTLSETSQKLKPKIEAAGDRIAEAGSKVAADVKDVVRRDSEGGRGITTSVATGERTAVSGLPDGTRAAVNDAAITTAVKAGFLKDPGLSVLKIDVDTKEGVVLLNGIADDAAAKERASQIAQGVKGVREVRNHLSVKQG